MFCLRRSWRWAPTRRLLVRTYATEGIPEVAMVHPALLQKAASLAEELGVLEKKMSAGESEFDVEESKRYSRLSEFNEVFRTYNECKSNYEELERMLGDESLKEEAEEELVESVVPELNGSIRKLKSELLPKHPFADRACILELRPGAGGQEADIFTEDLLEMYTRYCQLHKWPFEVLSRTDHESGNGITEATLSVNQPGSYDKFRHEAGVHRVQRVPATEAKGRVHTSASGVVVLPKIEDKRGDPQSRKFEPGELRIDVMRASGAGGQHVNKTESAVRLTHVPTGIVVRIQDDRSQHRNKEKAMEVMRARLAEKEMREKVASERQQREGQVSSVDRSDKIRTYNFQQNRVTDHRCNYTLYDLEGCMAGTKLDEVMDAVEKKETEERCEALIKEMQKKD